MGDRRETLSILTLQRHCGNGCVGELLSEHEAPSIERDSPNGTPVVKDDIERARSKGGARLQDPAREQLESSLGVDLGSVRVHTDPEADYLSRALNATAFTVGRDIFFRSGQYEPSSRSGQELLAHEVVHVMQQGFAQGPAGDLRLGDPRGPEELEAVRMAGHLVRDDRTAGRPVARDVSAVSGVVSRQSERGFGDAFTDCMESMGLPAPNSLFGTLTQATATIGAISAVVAKFGTSVTIAELVGAGLLSEVLLVVGGVTASFYAGACAGCLAAATGETLSGGYGLGDVLYDALGPEPGLWIADTFGI
jgi:hypothetical protein